MTTENDEALHKVGQSAWESIKEMVRALECDYDLLEELRSDRDGWDHAQEGRAWAEANPEDAEELAELEEAAGDCTTEEEARQAIEEDPLSVEVGGWWLVGTEPEATEYRILLATGGPAVRIVGELGQFDEPATARLEVQDWFKPWTVFVDADEDVLLSYVRCFYFGD